MQASYVTYWTCTRFSKTSQIIQNLKKLNLKSAIYNNFALKNIENKVAFRKTYE